MSPDSAGLEIAKAGIGYALFVFAVAIATVVIAALWKRNNSLQDKCDADNRQAEKDLRDVNEKRLEETRVIVTSMERMTAALAERSSAIQGQQAALADLTKGFAALVLTQEGNRTRFSELGERLEKRQEDQLELLRKILTDLGRIQGPANGVR